MYVFISFAGKYREVADRLAVGLSQEGHEVFFDRDDLPVGEGYDAAIRREVDRANMLIFLVAPESVEPGAYALTELKFARQRWRNPSGRILPVMVAPIAYEKIPGYLRAVTVQEPRGNLVAEVLDAADDIRSKRRRKVTFQVLAITLTMAGVVYYSWLNYVDYDESHCYLWAEFEGYDVGAPTSSNISGATLNVRGGGRTNSFVLSVGGRTAFQVDPDQIDSWTLELVYSDGESDALFRRIGCPQELEELSIGEHESLVLRPRSE